MSFVPPPQSPQQVEAAGARAHERHENALRNAEEKHRYGYEKRPGLLRRIIAAVSGKRASR